MTQFATLKQTGWGRYPLSEGPLFRPERRAELSAILNAGLFTSYIARGLGRSDGDTALNPQGGTIAQARLSRPLAAGAVTPAQAMTVKPALAYTVPCVLFGLFRYWFLVENGDGESPTDVVWTDIPLGLTVVTWGALCLMAVWR